VTSLDLARAARLLTMHSLREATGLFAGNYASAFRGGGLEFEESRPYIAGDDVRTIDWIATARSGQPFVKRFREERNQTLLFGLDVSASMRFGSVGPSKASTAAHAIALLAAAADRAGDRTGLVVFDTVAREEVPIGRGLGHTWNLIRSAVHAAARPDGRTDLAAAVRTLRRIARRHETIVVLSDFRDSHAGLIVGGLRTALAGLPRRCDVVACVLTDPREESLPRAGRIRVTDPETPGASFVLDTGSRRARRAYRAACSARRARLDRELRRSGVESVWLPSDRSPLHTLGRFFHDRASRRSRVVA
jgi:uncharacterized protein (DUF58 family)